ncbi:hypothetical protein OG897_06250 [Streptomyces sp. NBC_00237]|uniref:hypothetical protein n=1 Tax=Streptomyces sp. NBC_00237 TaxID=2975687 RepID=UPI002259EA3F|nr:hypothetical protein [Streptomyces sp. NBC_00237]MCX5201063.1 hypothetical protein [Streptomyces sp. NBC_00237]
MTDQPITPTRIIPAGEPLPIPPKPTAPPAPPPPPDWYLSEPTPAPPPPAPPAVPPTRDIHFHTHYIFTGLPAVPEPEPGPAWWTKCRPIYNGVCVLAGSPVTTWWTDVLGTARTEAGLAGAWVIALIPLGILMFADQVYRVAAAGAAEELWLPKARAAVARTLLWSALIATAIVLPVITAVYVLTGVRP